MAVLAGLNLHRRIRLGVCIWHHVSIDVLFGLLDFAFNHYIRQALLELNILGASSIRSLFLRCLEKISSNLRYWLKFANRLTARICHQHGTSWAILALELLIIILSQSKVTNFTIRMLRVRVYALNFVVHRKFVKHA